MGVEMKEVELNRAHGLGTHMEVKVRPIIIKFAKYNTWSSIFTNKNPDKDANEGP